MPTWHSPAAYCGDGVVDATESCEPSSPGTCQGLGLGNHGTVRCNACVIDTSECMTWVHRPYRSSIRGRSAGIHSIAVGASETVHISYTYTISGESDLWYARREAGQLDHTARGKRHRRAPREAGTTPSPSTPPGPRISAIRGSYRARAI